MLPSKDNISKDSMLLIPSIQKIALESTNTNGHSKDLKTATLSYTYKDCEKAKCKVVSYAEEDKSTNSDSEGNEIIKSK